MIPIADRRPLLLDLAVKAILVAVLILALLEPGWSQFQGKAVTTRAVLYPLVAVLVPVIWRLRGRPRPYPYAIDTLLVAPFAIDSLGNAANLYDTISWWDDANHAVNWALLVTAICYALRRAGIGSWTNAGLGIGAGASAAILWELGEYVSFLKDSAERATAYTDTLGDLALGLCGSVLAAVACALGERRRAPGPGAQPTIVTLCGSTRFKEDINATNARLSAAGNIVISLGIFGHADLPDQDWSTGHDLKLRLDELHKRKIDLADEVFIVDVNGYIGESTRAEIDYARSRGKPVRYLSAETRNGEKAQW